MKRICIAMGCFVLWISLKAQEQTTLEIKKPFKAITFDLLSPAYTSYSVYFSTGPSNLTRWRLGYRHQLNERWAIGADLGYGNNIIALRMEGDYYRLYELTPELQYLLQLGSRTQVYFSAQPFFLIHTETLYYDSVYVQGIGNVRFDSMDYKRTKYGLTVNYGFIFPLSSSMGFNVYVGGGIKRRENKYRSFVNPTLDEYLYYDHHSSYYDNDSPLTDFQFSFGMKAYFFLK